MKGFSLTGVGGVGFARCATSGCAALLADRLAIEETELFRSSEETL